MKESATITCVWQRLRGRQEMGITSEVSRWVPTGGCGPGDAAGGWLGEGILCDVFGEHS